MNARDLVSAEMSSKDLEISSKRDLVHGDLVYGDVDISPTFQNTKEGCYKMDGGL